MNGSQELLGVYSVTQKVLLILTAKSGTQSSALKFLTKRFVDCLAIIYKDFGVISYEFVGSNRFAILRHGEIIVNRAHETGTEKTHTILLDLEIDRILPKSNLVAFQSTKFENNLVVDMEETNHDNKLNDGKLRFGGFGRNLVGTDVAEGNQYLAFVHTDKLAILCPGEPVLEFIFQNIYAC